MIKSSHSGIGFSTSKGRKTAPPPTRTKNKGWTKHAAARNRQFLFSVNSRQLSGVGWSITLTTVECPTPAVWSKWRKNLIQWVRDNYDLTRFHVITEWQIRGQPHLHIAIWFGAKSWLGFRSAGSEQGLDPKQYAKDYWNWYRGVGQGENIIQAWLHISRSGGSQRIAQDAKPISGDDAGFWLQYLAKHAARGVSNYQRHQDNIPASWQGETCQVWTKGGDWPTPSPLQVVGLTQKDLYAARRIFCRYLSETPSFMRIKETERPKVQAFWRDYLSTNFESGEGKSTRFKGISSFIPQPIQLKIFKSISPDAYFFDLETGEMYEHPDEIDFDLVPRWETPKPPRTDMSDICGL